MLIKAIRYYRFQMYGELFFLGIPWLRLGHNIINRSMT